MKSWQERVIGEKQDLDEKIEKLRAFISTDYPLVDSELEKARLRVQLRFMTAYSNVLALRIEAFHS